MMVSLATDLELLGSVKNLNKKVMAHPVDCLGADALAVAHPVDSLAGWSFGALNARSYVSYFQARDRDQSKGRTFSLFGS